MASELWQTIRTGGYYYSRLADDGVYMSLFPDSHKSGMFIRAPLESVADCLVKWGNEVNRHTRGERKSMSLEEAWPFVDESRTYSPNRAFLASVGSEWTAFFNNDDREFQAAAELSVLCQRLKVDTCFFSFDHSTETEHCGSAQFSYYQFSGGKPPTKDRQVMLLKESGWKFTQYGEPLPFEDLSAYSLPKKKGRLTVELLRKYGETLGIPFWDTVAYGNSVYLLRWGDGPVPSPESTLKKMIAVFGKPKLIMYGRDTKRKEI